MVERKHASLVYTSITQAMDFNLHGRLTHSICLWSSKLLSEQVYVDAFRMINVFFDGGFALARAKSADISGSCLRIKGTIISESMVVDANLREVVGVFFCRVKSLDAGSTNLSRAMPWLMMADAVGFPFLLIFGLIKSSSEQSGVCSFQRHRLDD